MREGGKKMTINNRQKPMVLVEIYARIDTRFTHFLCLSVRLSASIRCCSVWINARWHSLTHSVQCRARVFTNGNYVWVKLWLCCKCLGKIPGLICRLIYNTRALYNCGMVCLRALKITMFHSHTHTYQSGNIYFIYFIHSSVPIVVLIKKFCLHSKGLFPSWENKIDIHCTKRR